MTLRRLWAVARKEALQLRRDTRSLALAFALPALLLLLFGYAITLDVRNLDLAVLDQSRSAASRRLVESFVASGYFRVTAWLPRSVDAGAAIAGGEAQVVLTIPPGFERDLTSGSPAPIQLLLDGSDANTATIAQNYAEVIAARFAPEQRPGTGLPVQAQTRVWYNENLESRNTIVPGLIAVIMSIIAAMLTALTIAREWERGTMEQLAATPVRRTEVVFGKLLPYVAIGIIDVIGAVIAGRLVFGVPLRGSLVLLAVLTLCFLIAALSWGMFVSAALKSQLLATQVAMLTTYLPALLLSGFIFSIAAMPLVLRLVTLIVPARYYVVITRGIFLKDVGLTVLWPEALALVAFAAGALGLALRSFKKQLA
ncbi:MAG: ABC transporter permease [Gemmatimonadota bacterium]|nr:ABC transporter permease [Gemmatimonadota bacterium]